MSTASVARHAASELVFRTLDESGELAYFLSESKSKQGKRNVTALDTVTGEVYCFCRAAELHRECWHGQLVCEAWLAHVAAEQVAKATTLAEVEAIGRAAKARIAAWGALTILVSPLDRAVYTEARRVYKRMAASAAAAIEGEDRVMDERYSVTTEVRHDYWRHTSTPDRRPAYTVVDNATSGRNSHTVVRQFDTAEEAAEWARKLNQDRGQAAESAPAPVATLTIEQATTIVTEWEGLSYSDRAIDAGYGGMTAYVMASDALISQRAA